MKKYELETTTFWDAQQSQLAASLAYSWTLKMGAVHSSKTIFHYVTSSGGVESNWVHLARQPLIVLLYMPRVIMMMENLVE
jgi:hypothetical protein